ncbi:hypothetical protein JNM87_01030 [Candidatus Saccharibacteria bacterium]|nr:hypothetical protein [Candidatus Saccharibacteria bacterium]
MYLVLTVGLIVGNVFLAPVCSVKQVDADEPVKSTFRGAIVCPFLHVDTCVDRVGDDLVQAFDGEWAAAALGNNLRQVFGIAYVADACLITQIIEFLYDLLVGKQSVGTQVEYHAYIFCLLFAGA